MKNNFFVKSVVIQLKYSCVKTHISLYWLCLIVLFFGCKKSNDIGDIQHVNGFYNQENQKFNKLFAFKNQIYFEYNNMLKIDFEQSEIKDIDSILKVMLNWDQKYRGTIIHKLRNDNIDEVKRKIVFFKKRKKIDSINYILLKSITNKIGWPHNERFSDSAVNSAFYIVLHMNGENKEDSNVFKHYIESAFNGKQISSYHYAVLIDHMLLRKKINQKYGTHCENRDGKVVFNNMDKIKYIDLNRNEIGLPPLNVNDCELMSY